MCPSGYYANTFSRTHVNAQDYVSQETPGMICTKLTAPASSATSTTTIIIIVGVALVAILF
jgi:hypothetical protein